ncbi:MAG TPA: hypothetical protein VF699_08695 [Caulobacteraceae bacterium]|jgi:hypothetical protein
MRHLSALLLASVALAGAAEVQAQPRDGFRLVNWPAKRDAAAAQAAAQPLVMGVPRENRYSPRRSAPTSTRSVATVVSAPVYVQVPAPAPVKTASLPTRLPRTVYEAPAPVAARPVYEAPAPVQSAAPPRLTGPVYDPNAFSAARQPARPAYAEPAPVQAAARVKPEAPKATAATVVDPSWKVREELMKLPPVPAKAQAKAEPVLKAQPKAEPVVKAEAKPAPAPKAETKVAAAAPITAPPVQAPAAKAAAAPVQAAATAPKEPWRTRTAEDGPRFYSLHRQFGITPDQAKAAALKGAAADPLPSAFFLAAAPAEDDHAEEDTQREQPSKKDDKKKKKSARRK